MLLEQILASDNLQQAWKRVKQNKGAAGVDGMTLDQYPNWAKAHWKLVKRGLERGYYGPQPVKRVEIPKGNGSVRCLAHLSTLYLHKSLILSFRVLFI